VGGAFYLGFLKPQLEFITHYVSTGIPNVLEGSATWSPPRSPAGSSRPSTPGRRRRRLRLQIPEPVWTRRNSGVVIFFARGEVIGGLNQLATFVTNDFEAVMSPFGAGCSNIVNWPLKYLQQGG